jgi:hypothetical protein
MKPLTHSKGGYVAQDSVWMKRSKEKSWVAVIKRRSPSPYHTYNTSLKRRSTSTRVHSAVSQKTVIWNKSLIRAKMPKEQKRYSDRELKRFPFFSALETEKRLSLSSGMHVECVLLLISQPLASVETPTAAEG